MNQNDIRMDLAARHLREVVFHDRQYGAENSTPRHYDINPTAPVFERLLAQLGEDLSNKRVLEYGCGTGWVTRELARRGASVSAFDISPEAVAKTRETLHADGVLHRCDVQVMAGEKLEYAADTFDAAVGFAILHHLDLRPAIAEMHRVLKPGGRALFAEPLDSNPLIRLYRRLTPQYRTADEAPLDLDTFFTHVNAFARIDHREQLLLAMAAPACCYIPGMSRFAAGAQRSLMRVDDVILRLAPWAGKWAWYSIIELQK